MRWTTQAARMLAAILTVWIVAHVVDLSRHGSAPTQVAYAQAGIPVTLSCHVRERFGNGLPNQRIRLSPSPGSFIDTPIDDNGAYSVRVSPGSYGINVDSNAAFANPPTVNAPQNYSFSATSPISLTSDTALDITVPARAVTVHVVDPNGTPIPGVRLSTAGVLTSQLQLGPYPASGLSSYSASVASPATTDATGTIVLWLFPTGPNASLGSTYTLTVTPPSGSSFVRFTVQGLTVTGDATETIQIGQTSTLAATPAGTQTVQVRGTGGFSAGSMVTFNPGGATEETARLATIGSTLVLETPLRLDHAAN